MSLQDKTVVITGANGGLGAGLVEAFVAAGARVIAVTRTAVAKPVTGAQYRQADLLDETSVSELFSAIGAPWAVINTVGGFAPQRPISDLDVAELETQQRLNLITAAILTKHSVKAMKASGHGRIIHTASAAAHATPNAGFPYSVSKLGVLHLVKMVAEELTGDGSSDIRIHAVSPTIIDTPANRAAMPNANFSTWATPLEIARAYTFLTDPKSPVKSGLELGL